MAIHMDFSFFQFFIIYGDIFLPLHLFLFRYIGGGWFSLKKSLFLRFFGQIGCRYVPILHVLASLFEWWGSNRRLD